MLFLKNLRWKLATQNAKKYSELEISFSEKSSSEILSFEDKQEKFYFFNDPIISFVLYEKTIPVFILPIFKPVKLFYRKIKAIPVKNGIVGEEIISRVECGFLEKENLLLWQIFPDKEVKKHTFRIKK